MAATEVLRKGAAARGRSRGFSMIEVLISLLIIQIGLLGLVGTQIVAQRAEAEAYQRAQAIILLNDMVERINASRSNVSCFAFTNATTGTPYEGVNDAGHYSGTCGVAMVDQSITAWDRDLQGAAERSGSASGPKIGSIYNARGCVSSFVDAYGITEYVVAVVWQGQSDSFGPNSVAAAQSSNTALQQAAACGTGLYSSDAQRRMVYDVVQIASLK